MRRIFTAYVEFDSETGFYVGKVPSLPGAHTQAPSLDELRRNLAEVIELVLEEMAARGEDADADAFVGIQQITVGA
jgi:predicted RNase H-like HicB family nuclease